MNRQFIQSFENNKTMDFHESIRLPAERRQLATIRQFVELHAEKTTASKNEIYDLVQAVDEAATNIIVHGYQDRIGEIEMEMEYQKGRIIIKLRDEAPPFDPTTAPEPDLSLPLHLRPIGGLGIYLIRSCVNEFSHSIRPEGGNEVKMVKYLSDHGGLK